MTDLVSIGFKADTGDLTKAGREFDSLGRKGQKAERDLGRSSKNINKGFSSLAKTVGIASAALTAFGGALAIRGAQRYAESMTNIQNQLRLVSDTTEDLTRQQEALLAVSNRSRAGFEDTARLYTTIRRNTEELGLSEERLLRVTETINKSFAVTGTTAQEAAGSIRQLSQGLAAGALRGDEFNSVAEGAPEILRAVSAETGMAIGELRDFAATGGITSELLISALENYGDTVDRIFGESAKTISQSMTVARNNFTDFIGDADSVRSAADLFGESVIGLSENLDTIGNTIKLASGLAATYVAVVYTIPAAKAAATLATRTYTGALTLFNTQASISIARLGLMQTTLLGLGAAFAGWQIGSYLREEFEVVEKAGIALASGLTQMSAQITGKFRELGEVMRFALVNPLDFARNKIIDFVEWINGLGSTALNFLGLDGLADQISTDLSSLRGATGEEHKMLIQQIRDETSQEVKQIDAIYSDMFMSVGEAAEKASENIEETNDKATQSVESLAGAVTKLNAADKRWLENRLALEKAVADLNKELNPQMALYDEWIAKEKLLDKALKKGTITVDQHANMIEQLGQNFHETTSSQGKLAKDSEDDADVFNTAWKRGIERVDDMFAGLWDSVFNGFEDFGSTLKRSFTGMLAELAHAAITRPIALQFQQAFSGGAGVAAGTAGAGAIGGAGGIGGAGTSILGAIQQSISGGNAAIVSGIERIGISIAGSNNEIFQSVGNFLFDQSSLIANALPYAGAALSLIQGDIKGAALQGAGVAIGTALGGPIGGAIGGALGSVVSGLFGDSPEQYGDASRYRRGGKVSASPFGDSLGGGKSLNSLNEYVGSRLDNILDAFDSDMQFSLYANFRQRTNTRGSFGVNVEGERASNGDFYDKFIQRKYNDGDFESFAQDVLDEGIAKVIRRLTDIPKAIRDLFKGLSGQELVEQMLSGVMGLTNAQEQLSDQFGLTVEQSAQVALASGAAGEQLAGVVTGLVQAADGATTLGENLVRIRKSMEQVYGGSLPANLSDFDDALKAIDTTTQEGINSFYELYSLRAGFSDYKAGINELKGAVSGAVYGLLNPAEQLKQLRANTGALFAEFGLEVPNSVQGLVQIASGIDYMTEEGLNLASVFPALVDAFTQTRDQADALADSLDSLDSSRFSNVVDFRRSVALSQSGIIPGFANGGAHSGGLRVVGERGPEIEATGPSRIFNQDQLINLQPLLAEIQSLRAEVSQLRGDSSDTARNTRTTADLLQRVSRDGESILTESVA